ncbi:MAG: SGNH/GDSL hydrolase family protein [Puniceicoccaceae bacterium]
MIFAPNSKVLFIGDSITFCERDPARNGDDLGRGYVSLIAARIEAHYPEAKLRFLNFGIGGNRVTDLEKRWSADVLAHRPDYVSVMIGINDVWRHFSQTIEDQVSIEAYEEKLEGLVERTLPHLKGMVLMTPYFLETNLEEPMRQQMDAYGDVVKKIAERRECLLVDTQAAFDRWLKHGHTQRLCSDRIHPSLTGHEIIAHAFLGVIGFDSGLPKR